jgi:hypothetical protein
MALRYWSGNATPANTNWNYNVGGITNWGSASGLADNVAPPTASDDVIFDGAGVKGNSNSTISATITVLSLTINSGYTATMAHNAVLTIAGNVTLSTPYTIIGSSQIIISAASTITSNGKAFPNNVTFSNSNTKTLNGNWVINGTLIIPVSSVTVLNQTGTNTLSCAGMIQSSTITGTAKIILTGGVWQVGQLAFCGCDLDLSGNISITNGNIGNGKTIKYISGTIIHSGTFFISGAATIDVAPVVFNDGLFLNGAFTITINSLLKFNGNLILGQLTKTYAGTSGWETNFLSIASIGTNTQILKNGNTYKVNSNLTITSPISFISDSLTLRANMLLTNGATCNTNSSFTRIDASGGRVIDTWNGVVTDCVNVRSYNDLRTVATAIIT